MLYKQEYYYFIDNMTPCKEEVLRHDFCTHDNIIYDE